MNSGKISYLVCEAMCFFSVCTKLFVATFLLSNRIKIFKGFEFRKEVTIAWILMLPFPPAPPPPSNFEVSFLVIFNLLFVLLSSVGLPLQMYLSPL